VISYGAHEVRYPSYYHCMLSRPGCILLVIDGGGFPACSSDCHTISLYYQRCRATPLNYDQPSDFQEYLKNSRSRLRSHRSTMAVCGMLSILIILLGRSEIVFQTITNKKLILFLVTLQFKYQQQVYHDDALQDSCRVLECRRCRAPGVGPHDLYPV
jgi:hypothetical protein